jgi:hypothetical protein
MVWLFPAALAGLALMAGPIAVHLFARHRARRVPFPTIRFVEASSTTEMRLRTPTDRWLLIVRLTIVALAVAAAAQPLVLTPWRLASWNARLDRAVVIDASPGMQRPDAANRTPAALAAEIARAEQGGAFRSARIEASDLEDGLLRAIRALDVMPPARREIVVISEFHQRALTPAAVTSVPKDIGLRFVRAGTLPATRTWTGQGMTGWRGARWEPAVEIDRASTKAVWRRLGATSTPDGLSVNASAGEEKNLQAALRAASAFGVPVAARDAPPIVLTLQGAPAPAIFAHAHEIRTPRLARIVERLRADRLVEQAARDDKESVETSAADPWLPVIRNAGGTVLVAGAEADASLVLRTSARTTSVFVPALLRALLLARVGSPAHADAEVIQMSDQELARLGREPSPVTSQAWPRAERTDARWFWMVALGLLLIEGWVRRDRGGRQADEGADARAA